MAFNGANAPWLSALVGRFNTRDEKEYHRFVEAFGNYSKLLDGFFKMNVAHSKLKRENKLLDHENRRLNFQIENNAQATPARTAELEQKLLLQQSQFIEVVLQRDQLKKSNETLQKEIADLNAKVEKLNEFLQENNKIHRSFMEEIQQLKKVNDTLQNEQIAAMLTVKQLEKEKRTVAEDNARLLSEVALLQKQTEELKNVEALVKSQLRREKVRKDLQEAAGLPCSSSSSLPDEDRRSHLSSCSIASVPDRVQASGVCPEDVNCVRFSPSGKMFASGGLDRKVWLWKIQIDKCKPDTPLVGCNASISSVDFDATETLVLGASSDFACRVWNLADRRLKVNLTGHSDRVVAARFFPDASIYRVATASIDRTIKIWDVNARRCIRTLPLTSTAHDVLAFPHLNCIASGHFDKKLRIWALDQPETTDAHEVLLPGRISGIDVSSDGNYVVASTRNDSLHTIDLRTNEVVQSFQAEDFHINSDFVKPSFSPDGNYVCCGSHNGSIFIWKSHTGDLETTLRAHENMVICTHWNPLGHQIVSCERGKKVFVWSQFGP